MSHILFAVTFHLTLPARVFVIYYCKGSDYSSVFTEKETKRVLG